MKCVSSHITLGKHRSMFLKLLRSPVTYLIHLFTRTLHILSLIPIYSEVSFYSSG